MKKICFAILATVCFSLATAQNGMFMPKTIDTTIDMYRPDTGKCYIIVIENVGFNNWAESLPLTWNQAFEWMTKGNHNYPESYWILNICDIQAERKKRK